MRNKNNNSTLSSKNQLEITHIQFAFFVEWMYLMRGIKWNFNFFSATIPITGFAIIGYPCIVYDCKCIETSHRRNDFCMRVLDRIFHIWYDVRMHSTCVFAIEKSWIFDSFWRIDLSHSTWNRVFCGCALWLFVRIAMVNEQIRYACVLTHTIWCDNVFLFAFKQQRYEMKWNFN